LYWLRTRLHDLFWFVFYKVILVSWPGSQILRVNLGKLKSFYYGFFFQFHHSTIDWLRIELHNLFWLAFYRVISI
jgi:hypothetical protein